MPKPYVFYIRGMTCTSCSGSIEYNLKESKRIRLNTFNVDLTLPDPKKATITLSEEPADRAETWKIIREIILDTGFECEEYEIPPNQEEQSQLVEPNINTSSPNNNPSVITRLLSNKKNLLNSHWFLGGVGCAAGIGLLIVCMMTGTMPIALLFSLSVTSILLTLALGAESYKDAWKKFIASRTLTMDTLFAISTLTVLAVSTASLFIPWLPMMFEAGLLIYGFRHIGIAIEDTIKEKINPIKFQDRAPKNVRISLNNKTQYSPLNSINPGDIIIVQPGEVIPLDGDCENDAILYNTIVTGSILPKQFRSGTPVLAGMKLAKDSPELRIRVRKPFKDSNLAQLDKNIEQSIIGKAPIELQTGKILQYFIPTVLGVAVLSGAVISIFFPVSIAITCAISVLVSACPCTLGLITPLAVKTGIHKALEHGVMFKNAEMLQLAERVNTVIFDLNGTLTTGVPVVTNYNILDETLDDSEFYELCSSLEKGAEHPIGKAIYEFSLGHQNAQMEFTSIDKSNHSGITARKQNSVYAIGNGSLMHELGISTKDIESKHPLEAGDSLIYLSKDNAILGYFIVSDPLRKDAIKTIKALKSMGKEIHLCTGADFPTALRYAKALGISHVHADSTATSFSHRSRSKPNYINALKRRGRIVAMIGDAGNDAHALAAADLGIAILSENTDEMTQKQAGVIIQQGNLLPIANGLAVSQQVVANIRKNLTISLGYNLSSVVVSGGLLLALGITLNPSVGVVLMIFQACFVLYNVYQFQHKPLPHLKNELNNELAPSPSSYGIMKQYDLSPESPSLVSAETLEDPLKHSSLSAGLSLFQALFASSEHSQNTQLDNSKENFTEPPMESPLWEP